MKKVLIAGIIIILGGIVYILIKQNNHNTPLVITTPISQINSDLVTCDTTNSLDYRLYTNEMYHFTFHCPAGLKIKFYKATGTAYVLTVMGDKNASITLTINGPSVPLSAMQDTTLDTLVTINQISMRKRLVSDPPIGYPPHQNQEIIYDYNHKNNTFTWWVILLKEDALNATRMNTIIDSFMFTD